MNQRGGTYVLTAVLLIAFGWVSYQVKSSEMGKSGSKGKLGVSSSVTPLTKHKAPDFTLPSLDGDRVSLAEFEGKNVVLLCFSSTSYPMCRATMPRLAEWERKYRSKGFRVVTLDYGNSADEVAQFVKQTGYKPMILLDDGSAREKYHVKQMPTLVLVDRSGTVSSVRVGEHGKQYRWVEAEICKLLGIKFAPSTAPKKGGFINGRN